MWECRTEALADGSGHHHRPLRDGAPISYAETIRLWRDDESFRSWLTALIADSPLAALRWETVPVSTATQFQPFEFVLLDAPELIEFADPGAFREHFDRASPDALALTFPNLSGDALMVVPNLVGPPQTYAEFATFLRTAAPSQIHAVWQAVGAAMQSRLGAAPVWLSTAGAGVAWLHVRLDTRPKYYVHKPYRRVAG